MLRYLIRRLLWAAVLFIAVTFVTYVIFFPALIIDTLSRAVRAAGARAKLAAS